MVNVAALLVWPLRVTVSVLLPVAAPEATVIKNLIWLEFTKVRVPTVIPVDGDTAAVVVDVKLKPLIVTVVPTPRESVDGEIEVMRGAVVTVKVRALLVPPLVVTLILRPPVVALEEMTSVAVI